MTVCSSSAWAAVALLTLACALVAPALAGNEVTISGEILAPSTPVAAFSGAPTSGTAPLVVQFTDTSTGAITGYAWDFNNDGTPDSTARNSTWTYASAGTYTVNLTVIGPGGSDDEVKTGYITVTEPTTTATPTPTPTQAGPFKPLSIPGRIEAEDYDLGGEGVAYHDTTPGNEGGVYRHDDVDIENTAGESSPNIGWIRDGEYLTYTANVTQSGSYTLSARVASPDGGRKISFSVDGVAKATIDVPKTGSFETFSNVNVPVALDAGQHVVKLSFSGDRQNINWLEFTRRSDPSVPFTPPSIPGRIEAEDYDLGGEGVAYHDTTPGNEGGVYRHDDVDIETIAGESSPSVGWIRDGEYLTYTANVTQSGSYTLSARVASPDGGRKISFSVDGVPMATIAVPKTGSFVKFTTVQVPVTLHTGSCVLKLSFSGERQNINWIEFVPGTITTPTVPAQEKASFTAAPLTASRGTAVKFALTPAAGKTIRAVWWSFDAPDHLDTWNSRNINPTFFYPKKGTFSPYVKITYTDGTVEEVRRGGYITAT